MKLYKQFCENENKCSTKLLKTSNNKKPYESKAHSDRSANLTTFANNALLADVAGDGDHRLVLTDLHLAATARSRLKVYKGTLLVADQVLPDTPSAIISFYTDHHEPKVPAIGVACNSELLIYKNTKAFFKFAVPPTPIPPLEEELWRRMGEDGAPLEALIDELRTLPFDDISGRSQALLLQPNMQKMGELVRKCVGSPPVKSAPIVCMSTLSKNSQDRRAAACPVLATEAGLIYILDPQTFSILHQADVCNTKTVPVIMKTSGLFDVEFRIVIACRDNSICILRRKWLEGKVIIQLTEDIVDMLIVPGDHFLVIGTTMKMLHCFTKRGQRLWSTQMVNSLTCLTLIPLKHLSTNLVAVGLRGGTVHLYHGRHPVDYTNVADTPSVLLFGQMGQEEHVLIVITMSGTLNLKILKRTADFNLNSQDKLVTSNSIQAKPLPLPKRSKLFLEQSMRERQNPIDMHQNFQQDLVKLRLRAARALVETISDQTGAGNAKEQVKLSAQVLGLGPKFTLILTLENMNSEKCMANFQVIFHAKLTVYQLSNYVTMVPLIPPGLSYKIQTKVKEVLKSIGEGVEGVEETDRMIRVFVIRKGQAQPVLAAIINMPPTEITTLL